MLEKRQCAYRSIDEVANETLSTVAVVVFALVALLQLLRVALGCGRSS